MLVILLRELVDATVVQRGEQWWMYLARQDDRHGATDLYSASLLPGAPLAATGWSISRDDAGRLTPLAGRDKSQPWDGNGGRTIYAATRSSGQIEEGPPWFSITVIDDDVVSWKFKERGPRPSVMITSPADERLITTPERASHLVRGSVSIRAGALRPFVLSPVLSIRVRQNLCTFADISGNLHGIRNLCQMGSTLLS
jgi:hypothetical protein